jgi:hypothetical protein
MLLAIIGSLAVGGACGWITRSVPSWFEQSKVDLILFHYENLLKEYQSLCDYLASEDDEDDTREQQMSSGLIQLTWICFCSNAKCSDFQKAYTMAVVVPAIMAGYEDQIPLNCPQCDEPLAKISDPVSDAS